MDEICIMVAPNGARRTRQEHPRLPITPDEIAETARACRAAGAGAIHLHVRDAQERHTLDADAYRAAIVAIRRACPDIAIQITTEAAGLFELDQQIASVEALRPACISFSLTELMREGNARGERFLIWAAEQGIAVQFILYDEVQVADFAHHWRAGRLHLPDAPRVILVVGRYSSTQDSDIVEFEALFSALQAERLDREAIWMTCAFGRGEMACLERTIECGGHARVGFENATIDGLGRPATDNVERVALVAALARKHGRAVADLQGAARMLGLRSSGPFL
jgi:uncharacterized protein (DUF849 family)